MLDEICNELLELTATEKGYRGAPYALLQEGSGGGGGSITLCCTIVLCCGHLCW